LALAQPTADNPPLAKYGLLKALGIAGARGQSVIIDLVVKRGVDFRLDAETERELRQAGAGPGLMDAIRAHYVQWPPPQQPCLLEPLTVDRTPRTVKLSPAGCPARDYSFEAMEAGSFTARFVPAPGFRGILRLLDAAGRVMDETTSAPGTPAQIDRRMRAGKYTLRAIGDEKSASADYSLQSGFQPLSDPETRAQLGKPVAQTLAGTDWRVDELFPLLRDRSPAHLYRISIAKDQNLRFGIESAAFRACLWLVEDREAAAPARAACAEAASDRVSEVWRLAAGDHLLVVKPADRGTGPYRLLLGTPECASKGELPDVVEARISDGACLDDFARPYDAYRLAVERPVTLSAQLGAKGFRPQIRLLTGEGDVVAETASGAGSTSASLERLVESGTFTLAAGSMDSGLGAYSLRSSRCPAELLPNRLEVSGRLGQGDCRLSPEGPYYQQFVVRVSQPATLRVVLSSKYFDSRVLVLRSDLGVLAENARPDAAGAVTVDRQLVGPGSYIIRVTSLGPSIGQYSLKAEIQ
jgi:hypothetical protein